MYGRYARIIDVINLKWLPIKENLDMNIVKLAHKSLYDGLWPDYLKVELINHERVLRSSDLGPRIKQGDNFTFQQQCTIFNTLPKNLKTVSDFNVKVFLSRQGF